MRLLHIVADGLLGDTLLLFAVVVLVGLVLAKRSMGEALRGSGTVLVGWLALLIGLSVLAAVLGVFDSLLSALLEPSSTRTHAVPEAAPGFTAKYVHAQAFAVLIAYVVNIAWAVFTRAKYIFLNPIHVLLGTAVLLGPFFLAGTNPYFAVALVAAIIGSAMAWLPYLADHPRPLNGAGGVALGSFHTGLLYGAAWLAERVAGKATAKKKPAKKPGPASGGSITEALLISGAAIGGLSLLLTINAGEARATAALGGLGLFALLPSYGASQYIIASVLLGAVFAAALFIVVHTAPLIAVVVSDSFKGFQRLIPRVRPALDAVFMLPESPQVAVMGFLLSLVGGLVGTYLFGAFGLVSILPGMLVALTAGHLIGGGAAGIIANRIGGYRALAIVAPAHGLVLSGLVSLSASASGVGPDAVELSDASVFGTFVGLIVRIIS